MIHPFSQSAIITDMKYLHSSDYKPQGKHSTSLSSKKIVSWLEVQSTLDDENKIRTNKRRKDKSQLAMRYTCISSCGNLLTSTAQDYSKTLMRFFRKY